VENYTCVITAALWGLTPAGGEGETPSDKGEANNHVPSPDMRDWVAGIAHVIGHDPDQSDEEASEHQRGEPLWALLWKGCRVGHLIWDVNRILLTAVRFRHE